MDEERRCCFAECWTGLNRSATRRWLQGEATREQTHELIAKTLEHILRTFGAPLAPQTGAHLHPQIRTVELHDQASGHAAGA